MDELARKKAVFVLPGAVLITAMTAATALAQTQSQVDAFLYDYEYRAARMPYHADVLVEHVRSNPNEVIDLAIDYCVLLQQGFTMQQLIDQSTYNAGNLPEDQQMLFMA